MVYSIAGAHPRVRQSGEHNAIRADTLGPPIQLLFEVLLRYFKTVHSPVQSRLSLVVLLYALLLAQTFLGALTRLLRPLDIYLLRQFTGVRKDYRALGHYLYKTLGNSCIPPFTVHHVFQLSRRERGNERLMTVEYSQKSIYRRDDEVLAVALIENAVGRDYFKVKFLSHEFPPLFFNVSLKGTPSLGKLLTNVELYPTFRTGLSAAWLRSKGREPFGTLFKMFYLDSLSIVAVHCARLYLNIVDSSRHEESRLGIIVHFALDYRLEARYRVLERNIFALHSCEILRNIERLR